MVEKALALVLTIALLLGLTVACSGEGTGTGTTGNGEIETIEPVAITTESGLRISVDPRMELLSIVQSLAEFDRKEMMINEGALDYTDDVKRHFSRLGNHAVVEQYERMAREGFSFDAPPKLMLYLTDDLDDIADFASLDDYVIRRAGGKGYVETFVTELRNFRDESGFNAFYNDHSDYYQGLVDDTAAKLETGDCLGALIEYYGIEKSSYNVILVPLNSGGYGARLASTSGGLDVFAIISPASRSTESLMSFIWHEFSHSYVNALSAIYRHELNQYAHLFNPIEGRMRKQAYGGWETTVIEHIIRAITSRLNARAYGDESGLAELQGHLANGFVYIEPLYQALLDYEDNRETYPTFSDFFPNLVGTFAEFSEADLEAIEARLNLFTGPINACFASPPVYIVPTNESGQHLEDSIKAYVEGIRDRFFSKGSQVITDTEALRRDLSGSNIVAYGTLTGNLWLKERLGETPFAIETDRIVADKAYQGKNLRFITAWPNPENPQHGLVIFTAQRARDVVGINSVFHGPTDFVVARGKTILGQGHYQKVDGLWSFKD